MGGVTDLPFSKLIPKPQPQWSPPLMGGVTNHSQPDPVVPDHAAMEPAADGRGDGSPKMMPLSCYDAGLCERFALSLRFRISVQLSKSEKRGLTWVRAPPGVGVSTSALASFSGCTADWRASGSCASITLDDGRVARWD